jgi:hypothetical protein
MAKETIMALTCRVCENAGVNCTCPPKLKRLIAKVQIAPNKASAEKRLENMKSEPGYAFGYMTGFVGDEEFSVIGMYDHGNALEGDHKEVFIHV